jgi:hypothetical protein
VKTRLLLLFLIGLGIGLLCATSAFHHPWISYSDCVADPAAYDGRVVEGFREPVIGAVRAGGFELRQRGMSPVFVRADTAGLKTGEYVALKAVFHRDGGLTAIVAKVASGRREKMAVSLFPAFGILILFFRRFRFGWKTFEFEMKSDA